MQDSQKERTKNLFPDLIRSVIPVISGKGGVGKSTVTALLALALQSQQHTVAIIDIDIHGPNIPHLFGLDDAVSGLRDEKLLPIVSSEGIQIASVGALGYGNDIAFIWRGPMKIGIIRQLICDVLWKDQSVLLVDTPPGTGDEIMTLSEQFDRVVGCVIVTTPQPVACIDAGRSIAYAKKVNLPILGVVENFSDSDEIRLFGSGGGKELASAHAVPYLGAIRLLPALAQKSVREVYTKHPSILPDSLLKTIYTAV